MAALSHGLGLDSSFWPVLYLAMPSPLAAGHAPGKIILCGEHAVVYGRPAIAAPVAQARAFAEIYPHSHCLVEAADLDRRVDVASAPDHDPFALIVRLICAELGQPLPRWRIRMHSQIPIASGLGSGAAIATAIARGLLAAFAADLPAARLSALVYEVERLHHGTPSGIDNSVVVYERPIWFVRGQPPLIFQAGAPLHLLIADTGVASPTKAAVAAVRRAWEQAPATYEAHFDAIAALVGQARAAVAQGDAAALGPLLTQNQQLLAAIGVSSPELDHLCAAALAAGAGGAKLSGGGRGGNLIALVTPATRAAVAQALAQAGAARVLATMI